VSAALAGHHVVVTHEVASPTLRRIKVQWSLTLEACHGFWLVSAPVAGCMR